jgi:hypothetical protein
VIGISVAALRKPTPLSLNRVCCSWEDGVQSKTATSLSRLGLVLTLSPLQSGAWNQRAAARAPLDTRSNSTKPREATIPCRSCRYERRCRAENVRPRVGVCGPRGSAFWGARRRRASPAGTWRTRACPASSAEKSSAPRARRCWPGLTGTNVPCAGITHRRATALRRRVTSLAVVHTHLTVDQVWALRPPPRACGRARFKNSPELGAVHRTREQTLRGGGSRLGDRLPQVARL